MSKLEAFETWLRATATPEEVAMFSGSVVVGILAVAGKQTVSAAHVADAVALARDAGLTEVAAMERLGELLVQFDAAPPPEPDAAPPPDALAISIRVPKVSTASLPIVSTASLPVIAAPRAEKPRRPIALIALAVVAVGGVGAWWLMHGDAGPDAAPPVVVLAQPLPDGWRIVHARGPTTLLARGDDQMFVATLPASAVTDELATARKAEHGASTQLVASAANYYSEGCVAAGERAAVCRGTATLPGGAVVTLQTYVRVGAKRALLAVVKAPQSDETAAIIDGFTL